MGDVTLSIPEFGFTLRLMPERAVLIEETQALLIADPHFGKSATFRKEGIPIPDEILKNDLNRLSNALIRSNAKELIILGDFFHSELNSEWDEFLKWIEQYPSLDLKVIPGNHDKSMLSLIDSAGFLTHDEIQVGELTLRHDPSEDLAIPTLCGHVHPSVTLRGKARQLMRLPAFVLLQNTLVLPAFGSFTGFEDLSKSGYRKAWVVQGDNIWNTK